MAWAVRWGEGARQTHRPPFTFPLLLANVFLLLLLFLLFIPFTAASFDFVVRPEFGERPGDLNVTTFAGQTAHLPCTVKHLAGKRVSWIRGRDLQVLSTGRITFSTDVRISVLPGSSGKLKSRSVRSVHTRVEVEEVEVEGRGTDETPRRVKEMPLNSSTSFSSSSTSASSTSNEEEDKMEGWKRQEEVVRQYSSSPSLSSAATSSSYSSRGYSKTQPHSHRNKGGQHHSNTHNTHTRSSTLQSHHTHKSTVHKPHYMHHTPHKHSQHHHTHTKRSQNRDKDTSPPPLLPRLARRRRRTLEWPSWTTDYFYYPFHHDEDTVSGLGGSPAWFHRELARFNSEGSRSYTDHQTPIAIYPQGPLTHDPHAKGHVPGPNYIEGVWEPEDYTLQIKYTEPEDAGTYICQINTEPRITQVVHLSVVNMRAEIVGSRELYVKAGTPVTLACKVNHGTLMPGFILWYKGDRLVEYDTSGGRISVSTEPTGVSHLLLRHARPGDSANYTCSPSAGAPASLTLNVIVDERQAAMQQGNAAPPPPAPHHHLLPPTLAMLWGVGGDVTQRMGSLGVLVMVGKVFLPTHIPLPLLFFLFLFLFLVWCILPSFCLQRKGRRFK
ncbi:uncharacterized protein LOC123502111 [Portunus trituberculatus]|uniref:uncharacterized protein LOC123502111 n=1 Tax=Portunus trituberculatus TaxID=210409 RepID=UPI001E1CD9BD|nr:uncharacterized protein LOC123502111 [Portunus trituberculatus]